MTKYTEQQVHMYRMWALKYGLSASNRYWLLPPLTLTGVCNGYGPDRWPEAMRDALTWIYRNMPVASQIHDERFDDSDGTEVSRALADNEMLHNMRIEVKTRYPLWKVHRLARRWAELAKAEAAYLALRRWGHTAWLEAFELKNTKGK